MEHQPRISIVTPSYNQACFLEETIVSVLDQNYSNLEFIVVDGGSSDESLSIIEKYSDHLSDWISEPDRGQSHAINKGFAKCSGDIITFCNSDDYYAPRILDDVATTYMENPDCGAIVGGFRYVDVNSKPSSDVRWPRLAIDTPADLTLGPLGVYRLHQAATFFSRSALDTVGRAVKEDLRYVMDRELLYRVAKSFRITTRKKLYANFRLHDSSKSVSQILPFAEEFAQLYLAALSGAPGDDSKRKAIAAHHRARGFLKFSTKALSRREAGMALLQALKHKPSYVWRGLYLKLWYHLLLNSRSSSA